MVMAAVAAALGLCAEAQADSLTRSGGVLTYTGRRHADGSSVTRSATSAATIEFDVEPRDLADPRRLRLPVHDGRRLGQLRRRRDAGRRQPRQRQRLRVGRRSSRSACGSRAARAATSCAAASSRRHRRRRRQRHADRRRLLRRGSLGATTTSTAAPATTGSAAARGATCSTAAPGIDAARYDDSASLRSATQPLSLTIDGVANDGAAGESDNILTDVEDLYGREGADVLVGSASANALIGGGGADRLNGGGGFDSYDAGPGADTVEARDGLAEEVNCGDDADGGPVDAIDVLSSCESTVPSTALQPDADGDGLDDPADCDDGNAAIRPGAVDVPDNGVDEDCNGADAVDLDRDGDGIPRPLDCDDTNAAIKPGARDKRGNKVDEDCKGGPAPYLRVKATVVNRWAVFPDFTRVLQLRVSGTGAKPKVVVLCKGGGCPFAKKSFKVRKPSKPLKLEGAFKGRSLQPGARVEVRVQRSKMIAKVVRYTIRDGKGPKSKTLCLAPGRKKPKAC